MAKQIGQRVKILGGMTEFVGKTGTISQNHEKDGRTTMYRVRLDEPVDVPGVGQVKDDIWAGEWLRNIRRSGARDMRMQAAARRNG